MPEAVAILPRCLSKDQASAYCGISPRTFDDRVRSGVYPKSMPNTNQWDKVAIDRAIDKLSGFGGPDAPPPMTPEQKLEQYKAERAARKAQGRQ